MKGRRIPPSKEEEWREVPSNARVDFIAKGDALITYPGDKFACIRLRAKDGVVRTAFLNEPLDDAELEQSARAVVEKARKEHDRRLALLFLDIPAMRAWARRYSMGLLGDDQTVLTSMHEARVLDPVIGEADRRVSVAWLTEHYPESTVLMEAQADA